MLKKIVPTLFISTFVLFVCSCTPRAKTQNNVIGASDSLKLTYATGFSVHYMPNYKKVIVYNPWDENHVFATYYLVKTNDVETPSDGVRLQIPLRKIAISSSTHIEPLHLLLEINSIQGICSPELIYNKEIREKYAAQQIVNLGDAMNINVEKTLQLTPQAVLMSGYGNNNNFAERLENIGIPIIYNNEWMENTLLARAEWIKFMAVFFDKEHLADSLFKLISNNYTALKQTVETTTHKPTIMTGGNFRGTWYMPAGDNYMARLFADAGANYLYASDTQKGSIPLTIEKVVYNFSDTDVWVASAANSLKQLVEMDTKHSYFKPYKTGQVYNFNKRITTTGANDFWEMGVSRPDYILADMIKILHPELMTDYEFVFTEKIE